MTAFTPRFLAIISGYPKSGKTGSAVALLRAGFRVIHADFDGNPHPIYTYATPEEREGRYIHLPFADKVTFDTNAAEFKVSGEPRAIRNFVVFLQKGTYTYADGTKLELGPSGEWSSNDVLLFDSTTSAGLAVMRRYLYSIGRTESTRRLKDWGVAAADMEKLFDMMRLPSLPYHLVVLSHLQTIGPEFAEEPEAKVDAEKAARIDMRNEVRQQQLDAGVKTRNYPTGIGKKFPQHMAALFPCSVLTEVSGGRRVFRTTPQEVIDIGVPGKVKDYLPIETGLLTIFKAVTGIDCPEPTEIPAEMAAE